MAQISRPRTGHDIHGRDDMPTGFGGTVQEIGVLINCGFFISILPLFKSFLNPLKTIIHISLTSFSILRSDVVGDPKP